MTGHVYIIGAGRSGTTLLSVLLAAHPGVRLSGELLQFPSFWKRNHFCSCGLRVAECDRWRAAGEVLGEPSSPAVAALMSRLETAERHRRVARYLLVPSSVPRDYISFSERLFDALGAGSIVVDASKYVARALALACLRRNRFRYVYIVRDGRGVIHSFAKPGVQEPRGALSAALYFVMVNVAAELALATRLRGRAIKIRYEDLVSDPVRVLQEIGRFLELDVSAISGKLERGEPLPVAHMISGNRLASRPAKIQVSSDDAWREAYGPLRRAWYYVLCLPVQLLNRYRP